MKNKLVVPGVQKVIDARKEEIANELGVDLGGHASAHDNGIVGGQFGGQITKSLVALAMQQLAEKENNSK